MGSQVDHNLLTQAEYDKRRSDLDVNPLDKISRRAWATAAGAVICGQWTPEHFALCVTRGFDEFERIARREMHGHGFRTDDYRLIFNMIKRAHKLNPANPRDVVNKYIIAASKGEL